MVTLLHPPVDRTGTPRKRAAECIPTSSRGICRCDCKPTSMRNLRGATSQNVSKCLTFWGL